MATGREYIDFVLEQLEGFGALRERKMFGEYMVYLNDRPILSVCDNTVFVKMRPELDEWMRDAERGYPYEAQRSAGFWTWRTERFWSGSFRCWNRSRRCQSRGSGRYRQRAGTICACRLRFLQK